MTVANTYTAVERAKHATITAGSEDVVNFTRPGTSFEVKVISSPTGKLWVRWDGTAATVGGDDQTVVESGEAAIRSGVSTTVLHVISDVALEYVIERLG